jgi:hypothetical protein
MSTGPPSSGTHNGTCQSELDEAPLELRAGERPLGLGNDEGVPTSAGVLQVSQDAGGLGPAFPGEAPALVDVVVDGDDVGRVEAGRRAMGSELCPTLFGEQGEPAAHQLGDRLLGTGEHLVTEAFCHPDEGRRGRDIRHRSQRRACGIGALVAQVAHEVAAA